MGEWPYQWKLSNVTPVYKKDDETSKSNYRPVSVISVIPNVFERIKYDQLYSAFTPIFSDNMSGFLRGHSCCTALLKLTDDWRRALDKKKDVGVVAIDLSKAFDSICHNLLLAKLKAYGVQDSALKLIQSYLLGRLQRVKCNGIVSDWLPFRCGVPQGSLLGLLLFNIFVNDVNYSAGFSSLRLYADDTTQYVSHECPALLESILNQDIKKLTIWFSANYLQVNATKTQSMTLGSSQYTYNFLVDDLSIVIEPTFKILGVTLDRYLSFKPHVTIMLKKAYAMIAALRRIKRLVPSNTMISLYKAYVLPHIEYCSQLLLGISKSFKNTIERANHYAIKSLLNLGNSATYDLCLATADMGTLEQRSIVQSLILFFKCFRLNGPNYISHFFTPRITNYNLRGNGLNVVQPSYNSLVMHNSFLYQIAHIWNQLSAIAKSSTTLAQFRSRLNGVEFAGCPCMNGIR